MANMLNSGIIVSKFELQLRNYVHLNINTLGEDITFT